MSNYIVPYVAVRDIKLNVCFGDTAWPGRSKFLNFKFSGSHQWQFL